MSRLPKVGLSEANQAIKPRLEAVESKLGMIPNIFKGMANSEATLGFYQEANQILGKGELSAKEREVIALVVAQSNSCNYCLAAHTAIAGSMGIDKETTLQIRKGKSDDSKHQALISAVTKIVDSKGNLEDADLAELRDAGYSDAAISEIPAVIAVNVFTNYFNHVNQTEVDFPEAEKI